MNQNLSSNTRATLLLTAPLFVDRREVAPGLLTPGEFNRLLRMLREGGSELGDLLDPEASDILEQCGEILGSQRMESLLGRAAVLSQAMEHWGEESIWVVGRFDAEYPKRFGERLGESAPPLLYGCGDGALLERGGVAVVGSRHADADLLDYTVNVGRVIADAGRLVISGGARGIDRAAMIGAVRAGGVAVGVLADSLERVAGVRENRESLTDRRMVLVSPYDPLAGFNVGHAMSRNKLIYALADAGLVVTSDFQKGGTWAGAVEQLERLHFVPLFVRSAADASKGIQALLQRGARPWPDPQNSEELTAALSAAVDPGAPEPVQETLFFCDAEERSGRATDNLVEPVPVADGADSGPPAAVELLDAVGRILSRELANARSDGDVAELLGVSTAQAKAWLLQLVEKGMVEKVSRPVRYRWVRRR